MVVMEMIMVVTMRMQMEKLETMVLREELEGFEAK